MNKYVQNDRVAVLINPTAGWYTVHGDLQKVFDPDLVKQVLSHDPDAPPGLQVEWLTPGDQFVIENWQGQEIVRVLIKFIHDPYLRPGNWITA